MFLNELCVSAICCSYVAGKYAGDISSAKNEAKSVSQNTPAELFHYRICRITRRKVTSAEKKF